MIVTVVSLLEEAILLLPGPVEIGDGEDRGLGLLALSDPTACRQAIPYDFFSLPRGYLRAGRAQEALAMHLGAVWHY